MRAVIGTWLLVISLRNRQNRLESAYAPSREEKAEAGPPMFKSIRTRGAHRETKVRRWVDSRTSGENRVPGVTGRERQEAASGEQCRPQRGTGETSVERQPLLRSDQSSVVRLGAVVASEASSGPRRKQRGWGRRQRGEDPGGDRRATLSNLDGATVLSACFLYSPGRVSVREPGDQVGWAEPRALRTDVPGRQRRLQRGRLHRCLH